MNNAISKKSRKKDNLGEVIRNPFPYLLEIPQHVNRGISMKSYFEISVSTATSAYETT